MSAVVVCSNPYLWTYAVTSLKLSLATIPLRHFAIAIAAAETAVAIAIIINVYRSVNQVDVRTLNQMKF